MHTTQTAVIVAVPEAEPVVGEVRARLDRFAGWGVPAHVTVLYPFIPAEHIDRSALDGLAEAVASVRSFDVTFTRVSWFGEAVLWLAPEPAGPFRDLTAAVWASFPACAPYGGAFHDAVPHLTIGHEAPVEQLRMAADRVAPLLPIRARVSVVRLIQGPEGAGPWQTVAEFPLGPPLPANPAVPGPPPPGRP